MKCSVDWSENLAGLSGTAKGFCAPSEAGPGPLGGAEGLDVDRGCFTECKLLLVGGVLAGVGWGASSQDTGRNLLSGGLEWQQPFLQSEAETQGLGCVPRRAGSPGHLPSGRRPGAVISLSPEGGILELCCLMSNDSLLTSE